VQADAPLVVASCGNAALAAAVMAAAAGRRLSVFIPPDADPAVVERLRSLGADLQVCPREPRDRVGRGDPCYDRFLAAVEAGALPFSCQGPDNGLTIDGGATLAWEVAEAMADARAVPDRVVIQVGGGALASAVVQGLDQALTLGVLPWLPTIDAVQTAAAQPLVRAYDIIRRQVDGRRAPADALIDAAQHRGDYMWPWSSVPASVARGILDDETYDWLAVVRGLVATGGSAIAVDEATLIEANHLARRATGIDVDETGSAGLAGLLSLARSGSITARADVVVVFTGVVRR
ncbi:MAG: pyridoxal-phosphate dependent enzyme, partial [Actinomycetota bacterium]|nr:pyridoxal-phosphate dependent enzyme [Actinomycetota bacterium]